MDKIEFTPELLALLKKAYQKAIDTSEAQFTFNGKAWVTDYAKYVIEYLDEKFK